MFHEIHSADVYLYPDSLRKFVDAFRPTAYGDWTSFNFQNSVYIFQF